MESLTETQLVDLSRVKNVTERKKQSVTRKCSTPIVSVNLAKKNSSEKKGQHSQNRSDSTIEMLFSNVAQFDSHKNSANPGKVVYRSELFNSNQKFNTPSQKQQSFNKYLNCQPPKIIEEVGKQKSIIQNFQVIKADQSAYEEILMNSTCHGLFKEKSPFLNKE